MQEEWPKSNIAPYHIFVGENKVYMYLIYLKIKPIGYRNIDKKVSNIYDQPCRCRLEHQKVVTYLSLSSWGSALQTTRFRRLLKKAK